MAAVADHYQATIFFLEGRTNLAIEEFLLKKLFIFTVLGLHYSVRAFSIVMVSRGYIFIAVASLVAAQTLVAVHRLSFSAACGIFPDQGLNPCPLRWQADSYPPHHQGNPGRILKKK